MKSLRIKDNCWKPKDAFSSIPCITGKIADKTLKQLEKEGLFIFPDLIKDAGDITKDQIILQSINDDYHAGNVMGFLGCGDERLVICSRFDSDEDNHFFQYLLSKVLKVPNITELDTDADPNNRLFDLMLFLFPHYLERAMRKGIFKTYIRRRYNDGNVKGSIDIARHIAKNTPFIGNVAYSQREYARDNYLMELVRHTIEFIRQKPYGSRILARVRDEVTSVVNATLEYALHDRRKIISANRQNMVRHAYFREYRDLQRLCLLILQHQKHQIGAGSRQVYGILFDGAWLWEEYIATLVGSMFHHPMNKIGKGAQHLFAGKTGLIYPDFISKDSDTRIIADAKYKPIDNIGNKDYLQLLAYMFRFDAKKGFYFYPEAGNAGDQELFLNKGSTYETVMPRNNISVTKHGLRIPSGAADYEDFASQMVMCEKDFILSLVTSSMPATG